MHRRHALLALWLLAGAAGAQAPDAPLVVQAISFAGNETTRPAVMLREIVIKPGDPADPALIERSRQAIQDLGLFRSVEVRQTPVAGGIELIFIVEEKWYILPIPRLDANSEGENAVGVSLRWFNVAGRNHTLRGNWTRRDEEKVNKGESTSYGIGYSAPFIYDTPFGFGVAAGHREAPITDFGGYTETVDSGGVSLSRSFAKGPASQGWSANVSLGWSRQNTIGETAPAPYGEATVAGVSANYKDLRFNLYSEDGVAYGASVAGATEGLGSDYSFGSLRMDYSRYVLVGSAPHQNVNVFARVGSYHGGPTEYRTSQGVFGLGGASILRAYPGDFVVGDFFYHVAGEYLRPIVADWLRGAIVLEAGNAFEDARNLNGRVYTSIGLGLRVRLTFLVNVEVEAGVAWPLDGGGQRFFASKV